MSRQAGLTGLGQLDVPVIDGQLRLPARRRPGTRHREPGSVCSSVPSGLRWSDLPHEQPWPAVRLDAKRLHR